MLYHDAAMSYMTENSAHKFYEGVDPPEDQIKAKQVENEHGEHAHDHEGDLRQKVINYCVVKARYEQRNTKINLLTGMSDDGDSAQPTKVIVGARLVGLIPCSDSRGYDFLIDEYTKAKEKQAKIKEQEMKVMKSDDNF